MHYPLISLVLAQSSWLIICLFNLELFPKEAADAHNHASLLMPLATVIVSRATLININ